MGSREYHCISQTIAIFRMLSKRCFFCHAARQPDHHLLCLCRCCTTCGQVLDEIAFSNEVTFTKGAGGISTADGQFVSDVAATRGLGRISGGRMYGYQVGTCLLTCLYSIARCAAHAGVCHCIGLELCFCMLWQRLATGLRLPGD